MALLHYLSYAAILAAFAFVALSFASGLLYVSELIEEHSRIAKSIGQKGIYVIMSLHVLLYFFDSLPLPQTIFSLMCHAVYLQNFSSTWPLISLSSISFLASCVLVIADHFLWFFHFAHTTHNARQRNYRASPNTPGFTEIATFFGICVWLVPLFLFLSLSANDNALPTSTIEPGSPSVSSLQFTPARVSLFRSILSNSLPSLRPKPSRGATSDGLIAPPSPNPPRSPLLNQSIPSSPLVPSRYSTRSPPRSPGPHARIQDSDGHLSPNSGFRLNTPPRRFQQPAFRQSSEGAGLGLGLRRATSSSIADEDSLFRER